MQSTLFLNLRLFIKWRQPARAGATAARLSLHNNNCTFRARCTFLVKIALEDKHPAAGPYLEELRALKDAPRWRQADAFVQAATALAKLETGEGALRAAYLAMRRGAMDETVERAVFAWTPKDRCRTPKDDGTADPDFPVLTAVWGPLPAARPIPPCRAPAPIADHELSGKRKFEGMEARYTAPESALAPLRASLRYEAARPDTIDGAPAALVERTRAGWVMEAANRRWRVTFPGILSAAEHARLERRAHSVPNFSAHGVGRVKTACMVWNGQAYWMHEEKMLSKVTAVTLVSRPELRGDMVRLAAYRHAHGFATEPKDLLHDGMRAVSANEREKADRTDRGPWYRLVQGRGKRWERLCGQLQDWVREHRAVKVPPTMLAELISYRI